MVPLPLARARLFVLALASGTALATLVFFFLRSSGASSGPAAELGSIFALLVPLLALTLVPLQLVLRRTFLARARARRAEVRAELAAGSMPRELFQAAILGCALAEGVGLLGALGYFFGGSPWLLAAPALAVALILAQVPTRTRLEDAVREL